MKYTKLFLLGLCSSFVFASCSDDEVEPNKESTEDTEVTDLEYSNDALINYVMSQFAELDESGNLKERTTFFRQMDESDSTAIYTCTPTLAEARKKVLSLVPESYQKKVIVKNDSAEMSLPMGTSPLMLTYKEGSADANVLATVQLPSQGAYTKIANTLTMVKSFGENAVVDASKYLGNFKSQQIKVLTSTVPYSLNGWFAEDPGIMVQKANVWMFCYNVTEDGVVQYMYLPPHVEKEKQIKIKTVGGGIYYILGHFFPQLLNNKYFRSQNDNFASRFEEMQSVLPSRRMVSNFIETFKKFTGKTDKDNWLLDRNEYWTQGVTFHPDDTPVSEDEKEKYTAFANEFREEFVKETNVVDRLARLSDCFPYFYGDYHNPDVPSFVERAWSIDWKIPFFVNGNVWNPKATTIDAKLPTYKHALSFATNQVYNRDKNHVPHVVSTYTDDYGEWLVIDRVNSTGTTFQVFLEPGESHNKELTFLEKGRDVAGTIYNPLRIVYLLDVKPNGK